MSDDRFVVSFGVALIGMCITAMTFSIVSGIVKGDVEAYVVLGVMLAMATSVSVTYALYPIVKRKMEK